jgi:hypothetical protein
VDLRRALLPDGAATLSLPLTHVLPYLREDTAGVASFILSFLGFVFYRVTRPET